MSYSQRRSNFTPDTANLLEAECERPLDKENAAPAGRLAAQDRLRKPVLGRRAFGQIDTNLSSTLHLDTSLSLDLGKESTSTSKLGLHKSYDACRTPGSVRTESCLMTPCPMTAQFQQVSSYLAILSRFISAWGPYEAPGCCFFEQNHDMDTLAAIRSYAEHMM